jgi:hypothetical protein
LIAVVAIGFIGILGTNGENDVEPPIGKADTHLPFATAGQPYSVTLQAVDVEPPVIWKEDNVDKLPLGLILNKDAGLISGIPESAGIFRFVVWMKSKSTDDDWLLILVQLVIDPPELPITGSDLFITTPSPLPPATVGKEYSINLTAKNGEGPLKWSSFNLPEDFALDANSGTLRGKPSVNGRFCLTISVTDSAATPRTDTMTFALTVYTLRESEQISSSSDYSPRLVDPIIDRLECGQILFNPPSKMKLDEARVVSLSVSLQSTIKDLKQELFSSTKLEEATKKLTDEGADTRELKRAVEDLKTITISPEKSEEKILEKKIRDVEEAAEKLQRRRVDTQEIDRAVEDVKKLTVVGRLAGATVRLTNRMKAELAGPGFRIYPLTSDEQAVNSRDTTVWKWNVTAIRPHKQKLHLTLSAILRLSGSDTVQMLTTFEKEIEVEVAFTQHLGKFYRQNWQWLWGTLLIPIILWIWNSRKTKKSR